MADKFRNPPSSLSHDDFIARYGGVYEHSPHFAERVWQRVPKESLDSWQGLADALVHAVEEADAQTKLDLLRAHPDLADRLGTAPLTAASSAEQQGAGLAHCSAEELAEFRRLNTLYKDKFDFPFIKAVRGFSRAQILEEFSRRVENDRQTEFATALAEIHKIARLRLKDLI